MSHNNYLFDLKKMKDEVYKIVSLKMWFIHWKSAVRDLKI
ncbi:hypothetical protein GM3709_1306 [Geminocystis sp. NIES-3709]|nr:hypothetical protein GM3709_1306 [Geminocystis sp. NIES-3709]